MSFGNKENGFSGMGNSEFFATKKVNSNTEQGNGADEADDKSFSDFIKSSQGKDVIACVDRIIDGEDRLRERINIPGFNPKY